MREKIRQMLMQIQAGTLDISVLKTELGMLKYLYMHRYCLQEKRLSAEELSILAEALRDNKSIQCINFQNNHIDNDGVGYVTEALIANNSLIALDLSGNDIGDKGAARLAQALTQNQSLKTLDLGQNQIGDKGMEALAAMLKYTYGLRSLSLHSNVYTGKGLRFLISAISNLRRRIVSPDSFLKITSHYALFDGMRLDKHLVAAYQSNAKYMEIQDKQMRAKGEGVVMAKLFPLFSEGAPEIENIVTDYLGVAQKGDLCLREYFQIGSDYPDIYASEITHYFKQLTLTQGKQEESKEDSPESPLMLLKNAKISDGR